MMCKKRDRQRSYVVSENLRQNNVQYKEYVCVCTQYLYTSTIYVWDDYTINKVVFIFLLCYIFFTICPRNMSLLVV